MASTFFSFPNPVNEKAARTVATGVLTLAIITIVLGTAVDNGWLWLTALIFVGFVGRVLTGPKLSLLGQLATRVIAPRLGEPHMVAGPPKRIAQAIGFVVTGLATLFVGLGLYGLALIFLAMIVVAATLEGVFGYCIGCKIFGILMRRGYISEEICESCADISSRIGRSIATQREASGTLAG